MENIKEALSTLQAAQKAAVDVQVMFNTRCTEFISSVRQYLKLTEKSVVIIGDTRQGVKVPDTGSVNWYGITTSAILDGYEKELLDIIQKETSRIISTCEKFK